MIAKFCTILWATKMYNLNESIMVFELCVNKVKGLQNNENSKYWYPGNANLLV